MVGTLRERVSRVLLLFLVDSLVGLVIPNAERNTFPRPRGLDSFRAFSPHGSYTGDRRIIAFQPRFDVCAQQEMGCIRVRGGSLESDEIGRDAAEQSLQGWFEERVKDVPCARRGLAGEGIFTQDVAADHRLAERGNGTDEETAICNEVRMCDPLDADTEADSADARALVEYAAALSQMGSNSTTEALETIERALSIRPSLASALALSARLQLQPELSAAVDGGFALKERPRCPAGPTKVSCSESEPSKMLLANAVGLEALVLGAEARMRAADEVGMMRMLSQAWQSNERRQAEEEIREQRAELKSVCRFRDELQNTLRSVRERVDKRSIQERQVLRQLALANAQLRATSARLLEAGRLLVRLRLLRARSAQLNDDSALACSAAEQELRAAVALDPAHPVALLRLARLLHARGAVPGDPSGTQQQWAATVECLYAGAIRTHPSQAADRAAFVFPEALCGLGNLSRSRGEVQKAKRLFAQAHALYPENLEAALSLATLHRNEGNGTEALRVYRAAVELAPDDVTALMGCAETALEEGRDTALSQKCLARARALAPNSPAVLWSSCNPGGSIQARAATLAKHVARNVLGSGPLGASGSSAKSQGSPSGGPRGPGQRAQAAISTRAQHAAIAGPPSRLEVSAGCENVASVGSEFGGNEKGTTGKPIERGETGEPRRRGIVEILGPIPAHRQNPIVGRVRARKMHEEELGDAHLRKMLRESPQGAQGKVHAPVEIDSPGRMPTEEQLIHSTMGQIRRAVKPNMTLVPPSPLLDNLERFAHELAAANLELEERIRDNATAWADVNMEVLAPEGENDTTIELETFHLREDDERFRAAELVEQHLVAHTEQTGRLPDGLERSSLIKGLFGLGDDGGFPQLPSTVSARLGSDIATNLTLSALALEGAHGKMGRAGEEATRSRAPQVSPPTEQRESPHMNL